MKDWKTTAVGVLKLIGALVYVGLKLGNGKPITDEDLMIVGLAAGGGIGNFFAADTKKDPQ